MALLGKPQLMIPCPESRKEVVIQKLLEEAVKIDDWTLISFVLANCWNKERIFVICGGKKLLHLASRENFQKTVGVLIEYGINIDARDNDGNTSLHIAALHGNKAVVKLLQEGGCNPFIENKNGKQAIDLAVNETVKGTLRQYNRKCSQVKMLKNLETWKNILAEEERKEEELKRKQQQKQTRRKTMSLQQNTTPIIIQPPSGSTSSSTLKRSDSGIISDFDSEKSASNSRLSITSVTSKTAAIVSTQQTQNSLTVPGFEKQPEKSTTTTTRTTTTKISKSRSFNLKKDLTNQYNNVTAAFRKLSSSNRNTDSGKDAGTSISRKNSPTPLRDIKHSDIAENNNKTTEEDEEKSETGGLKCSPEYGGLPAAKKNSKRKRKINRHERMSLPVFPMFAPPESYI